MHDVRALAAQFEDAGLQVLAGGSIVVSALTPAAGTSTGSTLAGDFVQGNDIRAAAGVSTCGTLAGSSSAVAAFMAAAGSTTGAALLAGTDFTTFGRSRVGRTSAKPVDPRLGRAVLLGGVPRIGTGIQ
jgi:hypothetical protein